MTKRLEITIRGGAASGKSVAAGIIAQALSAHGYSAKCFEEGSPYENTPSVTLNEPGVNREVTIRTHAE